MKTSTSQITAICSSIMVVIGVLMTPIIRVLSALCSVDPAYARKKSLDERVGVLPIVTPTQNVVIFPQYTPSHAKSIGDWRCKRCSSEQFVVRAENRICKFCGESSYYEPEAAILLASSPSFRNFNHNCDKRVTHFKNWIARLQGKERCNISRENLDAISARVKLYPDSMTELEQLRLAMKELKLQRYYNNVYFIMRQVFGYSLVEFRKVNEARLLAMFLRIQEPFSRIQRGRTNMLSYQFLIRKFCELLGYKLAEFIPTLKSRANLQSQDYIWKQICDELGLPYYPSV
jgi:hypothetical protein